jgi:hypothetical protein
MKHPYLIGYLIIFVVWLVGSIAYFIYMIKKSLADPKKRLLTLDLFFYSWYDPLYEFFFGEEMMKILKEDSAKTEKEPKSLPDKGPSGP